MKITITSYPAWLEREFSSSKIEIKPNEYDDHILYFDNSDNINDYREMNTSYHDFLIEDEVDTNRVIAHLLGMETDEERVDFLYKLRQKVCQECGSIYLPCYCTRDD